MGRTGPGTGHRPSGEGLAVPFRTGGAKKRRDANEPPICDALEAVGARVYQVSGRGLPDLLTFFRGRCYAMEVKTATGKRTPAQADIPWPVVRSVDDALRVIGAAR